MKHYMFRTVPLSIIRSLFTVHSAMVYVIQVCRQLSSRSICSFSKAVYKPLWHKPLLSVLWINSWWWTGELSETCRVSCQNKLVKLVHLVGFIIRKFDTMHGHVNVKLEKSVHDWTEFVRNAWEHIVCQKRYGRMGENITNCHAPPSPLQSDL
jgi:hypothetical protein